jgi:hypothetical protein
MKIKCLKGLGVFVLKILQKRYENLANVAQKQGPLKVQLNLLSLSFVSQNI